MRRLLAVVLLLVLIKGALFALSGCGAEAPPTPPPEAGGLSVSGEARFGVSGRF